MGPCVRRDDVGYGCHSFSKHTYSRSRDTMRPSCANHLPAEEQRARRDPQVRARGMPGARCTRSPCAKCSKHTVVTTVAPEHPAFPHAMVLTAYATLSPATNSSCHRHRRIGGFARPGWARNTSADLAPATGARTTRFCRPRPVFARRLQRHVHDRRSIGEDKSSIVRPRASVAHGNRPATTIARPTLPRPPHPAQRS
jgi:hypothetical protein